MQVERERINSVHDGTYDVDDASWSASLKSDDHDDDDVPTTVPGDSSSGESVKNGDKRPEEIGIQSSTRAKKEVQQVKLLLLIVVLLSIVGAVLVYIYTTRSEQEQFERQFEDDANKVSFGFLVYCTKNVLCDFEQQRPFLD